MIEILLVIQEKQLKLKVLYESTISLIVTRDFSHRLASNCSFGKGIGNQMTKIIICISKINCGSIKR